MTKERKGEENAWINNSQRMQTEISTKRCKQIASVFPRVFEERETSGKRSHLQPHQHIIIEGDEGGRKARLWVLLSLHI